MAGDEEDFIQAAEVFMASAQDNDRDGEELVQACCVVAKAARLAGDMVNFFKYTSKVIAEEACSEICCELGTYFLERQDLEEAIVWFYNAVYETESILNIHSSGDIPLRGLSECYRLAGNTEQAEAYGKLAAEWKAE